MTRDSGKKMKATYGYCDKCEKFYIDGEYTLKHDVILCNKHMESHEQELDQKYNETKRMYGK